MQIEPRQVGAHLQCRRPAVDHHSFAGVAELGSGTADRLFLGKMAVNVLVERYTHEVPGAVMGSARRGGLFFPVL